MNEIFNFTYPDLPIMEGREKILESLVKHQALIVQGGTGSGKTTQLPKFLVEAGYGQKGIIGVTQPRRIAALSITDRLRQEMGRKDLVGAKIRFHEDLPSGALVKVMTDGILLQEFRRDPWMRQYSCIVLDEAHERSLNVDILLGIFKTLLPRRPELRLIVTSATLDAQRFAVFFGSEKNPAPVVEVEGRQFPVALEYWDITGQENREEDSERNEVQAFPPLEAAAIAIKELQARRRDNLLAFLPTEKEIHELHRELERDLGNSFSILPLYGRLGPADQRKVFQDSDKPKIILATNIAETSLTIPGIGYVVDMGLARVSSYHPHSKIQGLPIERISRASAKQRAGRAGRVKAGICVRLYSQTDFEDRDEFTEPEILRSNLSNVILQLLALGLPVENFPFPDPPSPSALKGAYRQLHELGAVSSLEMDARLTEEGRKLSQLPVDVTIGKILLTAKDLNCLQPALILAAGITVQDARYTPREEPERGKAVGLHRRFEDPRSDFLGILALWNFIQRERGDSYSQRKLRVLCEENFFSFNRIREWMELTEQFCRLLKVTLEPGALKAESFQADNFHKSILAGFMPFLARRKREDISYRLAGDKEAFLHPGSSLAKRKPEWIVAGEVRQTSRVFIFRACEINPAWIEELAPELCKKSYAQIAWNGERGFVEALERVSYKGFAIKQDRRVNYESIAPEECAEIFWLEGVVREGQGAPFPFREKNIEVLDSLAGLEKKLRVRALVPDEMVLAHWYQERAKGVTSRIRLEKFLKDKNSPSGILEFSAEVWLEGLEKGDWSSWKQSKAELFPDTLESQDRRYRLGYLFDYGNVLDGISIAMDPEGLAQLSLNTLVAGIIGWRKWIWEYFLERLGNKASQAARGIQEQVLAEWDKELKGLDQIDPSDPIVSNVPMDKSADLFEKSSVSIMVRILAAKFKEMRIDSPGNGWSLPATWPANTQIHILVESKNGRRFLMHVDPSVGESEFFAAKRKLLYGENLNSLTWKAWSNWALGNFQDLPSPLLWKGKYFAVDALKGLIDLGGPSDLGNQGNASLEQSSNALSPITKFYQTENEASFNSEIAKKLSEGFPLEPKSNLISLIEPLEKLFIRRFQTLMDLWNCPDPIRKETERLQYPICNHWLPCLYIQVFGDHALAQAEKDFPPVKLLSPVKSGAAIKSLSNLNKALVNSNGSGSALPLFITMGAAFISLPCFIHWMQIFSQQNPLDKKALENFMRDLSQTSSGELWAQSLFYANWAAKDCDNLFTENSWPKIKAHFESSKNSEEQFRKTSKSIRDSFCNRLVKLGQTVGGLSQEMRDHLANLDRPISWSQKINAELELEVYLQKLSGRIAMVEEKKSAIGEASNTLGHKETLLKGLNSRYRKL